jgi:quinolinate synthase
MKPVIFEPLANEAKRSLSHVQEEILRLKKEKNAVILAHNYVEREIQEVADYVGDSLGLSFAARDTDADIIVFCGVDFMAETAKILNPAKKVLMPDADAGCSLSESCSAEELGAFKAQHPGAFVVSYINCSGAVKAISDVICTSGNAVKIVGMIPKDREIIFAPDKYLGGWVEEQTGRKMILWDGCCCAHAAYDPEILKQIRSELNAPVVGHPECPKPVRDVCDMVCSTEKMINWAKEHLSDKIIVATVRQMIHRLRKEIPNKTFIAAPLPGRDSQFCRHMDKNTVEKLLNCLQTETPEITVDPELAEKARGSIDRMLEWSK